MEILLKQGANPNEHNSNGATPLHWAAYQCADCGIFELLLDHKADPNVRSSNGRTPLDELKATLGEVTGWPARFKSYDEKAAQAKKLIAVLHQHGALDRLPNWDRITVGRAADNISSTIFVKGTNDWNHFTLVEAIANVFLSAQSYQYNSPLRFPDLAHITILRPHNDSTNQTRIAVNLLNANGGIDCSNDVPLQFGDVVEIPERDHALGDNASGLTDQQRTTLADYAKGSVRLVAGDQKVQIPIYRLGNQATLETVLGNSEARKILLASSDLSRVKVIRRDSKTGERQEWVLDCSPPGSNNSFGTLNISGGNYVVADSPGQPLSYQWYANASIPSEPNLLWLRDGDVIEVPEKP